MFNYTHETIRFMSSMDTYEDKIDDSISHNYEHDEVVIFAPFLLLAIGAFLRHTTKSLPLPYTMQLLVLGSLLGIFLRRSEWDDALQQSVSKLGDMDPHLMLHIFLPPLVFESAASIEWHLFTKAKWYIISLAGPGLLLASGLTGYVINILLGQSERFSNEVVTLCPSEAWSAQAALMLGVIMSATDPVAVVALLKDLGCKASLATAIEGESLLNDGTALVLYTILVKIVEGDSSDNWGDYFVTFIKMSFGGALFGTTFALIVVQWLRMIFNDAMSEITITLAAAYLCFFIAEYFLHISGVIAVVCLGLYFGHSGRTSVSPEVGHFLGEFWELLAYFGNTLIFVVAGTVIGYKLPSFPWWDFVQMIIMYIACTIIRATVVGIIYFIFRQCGAELEKEDQVIAIWAGLRGAVGLSLAMMVFSNSKICEPIREIVMFHTAGIVVLTVCINSTTIPKVVNLLGLDAIVPSKQLIYDQAMTNIIAAGKKQESNIRADHMFDSAVWEEARHYYFRTNSDDKIKNRRGTSTTLAEKELRRRVLMITKKSYWRQFQDGLLSNHSVKYLTHHTDIAIDNDCTLNEWQTYVELNRLGSRLDKSTDKLIASEASSNSEKQRVKLLNFLDSVPVILTILLLVFASCILPFTIDETSRAFLIIENSTTAIFITELLIRLYCLQDWNPCAVDPYIAIDVLAVLLDILLLSAEDVLGVFSEFSKSIRSIRFLRLFRLLRLARLANRLNKVKIAAMNENTTFLGADTWFKRYQRRILFSQLKHGYEVATGFKVAREEVLMSIKHLQREGNPFNEITEGIEKDLKAVRTALLDIQRLYSEIAASITTVVAARTVLNRQRLAIEELHQDGLLDTNEYKKIRGSVEYKMKKLTYHPPIISMPKKIDILRQIPWLDGFSADELSTIISSFQEVVFQRGNVLVEQDDSSDSVHVLARGTVVVLANDSSTGAQVEIDELGIGSVFGEIACVLGCRRLASIRATSPGLLFTIPGHTLRQLLRSNNELEKRLWKTCGCRLAENLLAQNSSGNGKSRRQLREIVHDMNLYNIDPMHKNVCFHNNIGHVIVLQGVAIVRDDLRETTEVVEAPDILSGVAKSSNTRFIVEFSTDAKYMCNPLTLVKLEDDEEGVSRKLSDLTSMAELELRAARSFRKDRFTAEEDISPTIDDDATLHNHARRYSTAFINQTYSNDHKDSNMYGKRRSTIDIGSASGLIKTYQKNNIELENGGGDFVDNAKVDEETTNKMANIEEV